MQAVVAGMFQACYSLGDGLGPILGGNLVYYVGGFPEAAFYFGCVLFAYGVLVLVVCFTCPLIPNLDLTEALLEEGVNNKTGGGGSVSRDTRIGSAPKTPLMKSPLLTTAGALRRISESKEKIIQDKEAQRLASSGQKPVLLARKSM